MTTTSEIPEEMLKKATKAILTANEWIADVIEAEKPMYRVIWNQAEKDARAALEAAGVAELIAERDRLRAALAQLCGVIDVHETRSEDCDRSGKEYCDCLDKAVEQARQALGGEVK